MSTAEAASANGSTSLLRFFNERRVPRSFLVWIPFVVALSAQLTSVTVIAQNGTVKSSDSFAFSFFNQCTGEVVSGVVNVTTTVHVSADANGGFHAHFHDVFSGRAVGETSGIEYVGPQTDHDSLNVSSGGTLEETFTLDFRFLSLGGEDNILSHVLLHTTVTPDGEVKVEIMNITNECRG
jgi:hypothetical protein